MKDSTKKKVLRSEPNKIDSLPNQVLYNILSFMDMKEVVATSVVSRRWRYLWESVSILNFDHHMWNKKYGNEDNDVKSKRFMSFVDRVLLFRDGSKINKFNIVCALDDSDRLITWLTLAARRKFQEIHLELDTHVPMELPDLIFTSAITVFKIVVHDRGGMPALINIPSSVSSSPQLKTLILDYVILPEGNSDGELIIHCPVLENLTLQYCDQTHLSALIISTPQLKTLVFEEPRCDQYDSCNIKVWTPNLISLEWYWFWYNNFSSRNLSKLVFAEFNDYSEVGADLVEALGTMSCATIIKATFPVSRGMSDEFTSQFSNLRHLTLDQFRDKMCFQFVLKLLKNAPCLETLILHAAEIFGAEKIPFMAEDFEEEEIPFVLSHLKSIDIDGKFEEHEKVVEFLKVILKKAIVLEELIVQMSYMPPSIQAKAIFAKQIRSLARAVPRITVIVN